MAQGGSALESTRQKVHDLKEKYTEIEGVIQERKRNRANLLEAALSGTTVLSSELEKLAILSGDEEKAKLVTSLARSGRRDEQSKSVFNLSDILSSRQTDFERRQESQAFHNAKLRGQ